MLPRRFIVVLLLAICFAGCATEIKEPPIEVTYRRSLLGAGNIVQVKNLSNLALEEVEVSIRSSSGEVAYQEAELAGYATLEVGWKKLDGYEIPDTADVEVRAKGFLLAVKVRLDAEAASEGESES